MGAWGMGTFENDDAMDWIADFSASPSDEALRAALARPADADGYLESPDASNALAAAEVVAALKGAPTANVVVVEDYLPAIARSEISVTEDLTALALRAIDRVVSDSELKELWDEVDDASVWRAEVAALRDRVAGRT
ncbi:MAG: DUF4259 domain-containing protein [Candidatus Eremiobacteraeota bacterium]|nr:DUF4259 domain-containing protein [Candidatus Eremiobacteraeota bacterium]